MSELFDTAKFSSKNHIGGRADSAWDDGSAFPDISSKKIWKVGDRIITPANQRGLVTSADKKIGITWENGHLGEYTPKEIQAYGYQKFLEEKEATECNSNTPASSQELEVLNSELMPPEHPTESLLNSSLKITATRNSSSNTDSLVSPSTATSKIIAQSLENSTSTQSASLAPAPALQATEQDLTTQNQDSGLKPCDASPMVVPVSSSLKILQDLSTKDYEQFLGDSEWLAMSGMIRKSYQLRNSDRPKKGKGFSSLPTPTTYAKGSTGCRPAGATRLEQKLRPYITKGDKLNPAVPGWMMGFPVGWAEYPLMDTGETISVQLPFIPEYATTLINDEIVTTSTLGQSAPSKQQLQSNESVISPILQKTHRGYRIEFSKDGDKIKFIIFNENWVVRDYPWCKYDSLEEAELDAIDWLDKFHPGKKPTPPSKETLEQMSRAFYKERSQLDESVTQLKQSDVKIDLYICNSSSNIGKIIEVWQTCFTVDWSGEIKCYFWERDEQVISKLALAQPASGIAPQHLIDKFFSQGETLKRKVHRGDTPPGELCKKAIEDNHPQLCTKCFQVVDRDYTCDKCIPMECTQQSSDVHCPSCESPLITLNDSVSGSDVGASGCGVCGWIPENFLEETEPATTSTEKPKHRQRKGCLYKYLENKKLKNGSIVSYPRVIGHRHPDNPTHWRWGFNWEEKIDGEWKGRSIGSVPLGAIALIQSMQNEGVPLEEIIGFIKRAKAKK